MRYLKESKEFFQTRFRPLTKYEIDYCTKFLELVKKTFDFFKSHRDEYRKKDDKFYKDFIAEVKPYFKYPFAQYFIKYAKSVEDYEQELNKIDVQNSHIDDFLKTHEEIIKALKNNDIDKAIELNTPNRMSTLSNLSTKRKGLIHHASNNFRNPFWFQSNFLFYSKDSLVKNFDGRDVEGLIKHFSENSWTDSKKSLTSISDPDSLIFAIQQLKKDDKIVKRVNDHEVEDWVRFNLKEDPKYIKVVDMVNHFLYSNDKKQVDEILKLIDQIPVLKRANDKLKLKIKKVYRGVGAHGANEEEVIEHDKKQQFVSTSESRGVAENFALGIGHLESREARRNEDACVIAYETNKDSILFGAEIFGSAFGEREVIIDAKKAKVIGVSWI